MVNEALPDVDNDGDHEDRGDHELWLAEKESPEVLVELVVDEVNKLVDSVEVEEVEDEVEADVDDELDVTIVTGKLVETACVELDTAALEDEDEASALYW